MADKERVAIVTGGAAGIGRAIVEKLTSDHAGIVIVDIEEADLAWTKGHEQIETVFGDVSLPATSEAMVAAAIQRFGRLDTLVLNAAIFPGGFLEEMDIDLARKVMDIDLWGVVYGMRAAAAELRKQAAPSIVVTASVSGLGADPGLWAYNTAKGAVINLVRSASWDLARTGIRVNAVCPGPIGTQRVEQNVRAAAPQAYEALRASIPLGRWGRPEEAAAVVHFLASPAASFVNGAILPVDGGIRAGSGQFKPNNSLY